MEMKNDSVSKKLEAIKQSVIETRGNELYIPLNGKHTTNPEEESFDLAEKIQEFFVFKEASASTDPKVMLLMGGTGAGKSVFSQQLHQQLWRAYTASDPIPLWIPLPELDNPFESAVEEVLRKYGMDESQLSELKVKEKFIFIVDGYDELHQFQNCYVTNKWDKWKAKVLITCRSQALYYQKDPDKYFMPFNGDKRLPMLLRRLFVAPFSKEQINTYVKKYRVLNTEHKISEEDFSKVPGLTELINTPFLLHCAVEALPDILTNQEAVKDNPKITQAKLYDVFIEQWFTRQIAKLRVTTHVKESDQRVKQRFWGYCKNLAQKMHEQNVSIIPYQGQKVGGRLFGKPAQNSIWDPFFNDETELVRSACPLKRYGEHHYGFIHASMVEYFATRAMYEEIQDDEFTEHNFVIDSEARQSSEMIGFPGSLRVARDDGDRMLHIPRGGIHQRLFSLERQSIQFLADRIELSETFRQKMLTIVEASKMSEKYAVGAANAITALVRAYVSFNRADLSGIKVSGADISGGYFDRANISFADLRNVQMYHVWLRETNLEGSQLEGLNFGEYPWFKQDNPVRSFDYREDLQRLVTANKNEAVIWDTVTGTQLLSLEEHPDMDIQCVRFSPNGKWVASSSSAKSIDIWDVSSGNKAFEVLDGRYSYPCKSVKFSPDGERLLCARWYEIRIWEIRSGKKIVEWLGHKKEVNDVAFSPEGNKVASGSADMTVRIWDINSSDAISVFLGHEAAVQCVAFSLDGKRLVSGSSDRTVRIWDPVNQNSIAVLRGHGSYVQSVVFSVDGEQVLSGGLDMIIRVWEVASRKEISVLRGHEDFIYTVQFSSLGTRAISGSKDKTVRMWDIASGHYPAKSRGHGALVSSVAFNAVGDRIASSGDETVKIWNVANGQLMRVLHGHKSPVNSLQFSPDDRFLVSGSGDKFESVDNSIRVWSLVNEDTIELLEGHKDQVNCVKFSPDGKLIASCGDDKKLIIWNALSGEKISVKHDFTINSLDFSPDGTRLVLATSDNLSEHDCQNSVRIQEVATGIANLVLFGHGDSINSVEFSSNGELVVSGSRDKTVRVFDIVNKKDPVVLSGHEADVNCVHFSKDNQQVISGSNDKTIRFWNIYTAQCLHVLKLHGGVTHFSFHNPETLVVGFREGSVEYWHQMNEEQLCYWHLQWSSDIDSRLLYVENLRACNVLGLSDQNRRLLEQRGAIVNANQDSKTLKISSELIVQVASRSGSPLHQSPRDHQDNYQVSQQFEGNSTEALI